MKRKAAVSGLFSRSAWSAVANPTVWVSPSFVTTLQSKSPAAGPVNCITPRRIANARALSSELGDLHEYLYDYASTLTEQTPDFGKVYDRLLSQELE